jgi:ribosomal protein S18 acetylase RimI-like enzyme
MPDTTTPSTISLRPITPADESFLLALYSSTREEELLSVPWTDAQKRAFLEMQFRAQHQYYQQNYQDSTFDIILANQTPAGRLYVARWPTEIRIIDIAFLPTWRRQGLGTTLLHALQSEATHAHKTLTIHVERMNPALHLYERLGFVMKEDKGVYLFLEWTSEGRSSSPR